MKLARNDIPVTLVIMPVYPETRFTIDGYMLITMGVEGMADTFVQMWAKDGFEEETLSVLVNKWDWRRGVWTGSALTIVGLATVVTRQVPGKGTVKQTVIKAESWEDEESGSHPVSVE